MQFVKSKNMMEGEKLLYIPKVHWLVLVKPIFQCVSFLVIVFFLWILTIPLKEETQKELSFVTDILNYTILVLILISLINFLRCIFLYLNTEFGITNKRLIIKKGVFRVVTAEIPTDRIESIYCVQGFWERLFHCGSIYIGGVGGSVPAFFMVYRPYALRRKIVEIVERNKAITVVNGELPKPIKPAAKKKEYSPDLFGTFVRVIK